MHLSCHPVHCCLQIKAFSWWCVLLQQIVAPSNLYSLHYQSSPHTQLCVWTQTTSRLVGIQLIYLFWLFKRRHFEFDQVHWIISKLHLCSDRHQMVRFLETRIAPQSPTCKRREQQKAVCPSIVHHQQWAAKTVCTAELIGRVCFSFSCSLSFYKQWMNEINSIDFSVSTLN